MLKNKIALVTGATRGAGRGIACMLGEAGATVYCTGRSSKKNSSSMKRPETIEETAELASKWGGKGVAMQVDHTDEQQVKDLMHKIRTDHGKLDILVNDIWGGDTLTEWGQPFWKLDFEKGKSMFNTAIYSHIVTSKYAFPLIEKAVSGIIIEITDGDHYGYRGNLYYDLVKTNVIRLANVMAWELRNKGINVVAVTPGFLRSEAMLDHFGVTEENWQDGGKKDPDFLASESPFFVGRCIAKLCAENDLSAINGKVLSSWDIARQYAINDVDGTRPDWGHHFKSKYKISYPSCNDQFYKFWDHSVIETIMPNWP